MYGIERIGDCGRSSRSRLIIDGNYFFHRQVFASRYKFKGTEGKSVGEEKVAFVKDCMLSLANLVSKPEPYIDGVEFVRDSGSWRKDVEIVSPYKRTVNGYKGTREKDDEYNWSEASEAIGMFYDAIGKAADISIICYPKAEGDDAMYVRSRQLEQQGYTVMLWSSDNDTKGNITDNISFLYDKTNTLYVSPNNYRIIRQVTDEEYMMVYGDGDLPQQLRAYKVCTGGYDYVDTLVFMAEKIVVGDDGDNVPAIHYRFEPSEAYGFKKFKPTSENITKAFKECIGLCSSRDMNVVLYDEQFILKFVGKILSLEENYERRRDKALKEFTRKYKEIFKSKQPAEKPKKPKKGEPITEPVINHLTAEELADCFFDNESGFVTESYIKTDTGIQRNNVDSDIVNEAVLKFCFRSDIGNCIFWDTKKEGRENFETAFDTIYREIFEKTFNHTDFQHTLRCFVSNRRMMMLNDTEIPKPVIEGLKSFIVKPSKLDIAKSFAELIKFLPSQIDRFWESRFDVGF